MVDKDRGLAKSLTAWQTLVETAHVDDGSRVLINGAAGGVGHVAVQIARARGAHVVAVASAANVDFVRSLGADEVIDYTAVDFTDVASEQSFSYSFVDDVPLPVRHLVATIAVRGSDVSEIVWSARGEVADDDHEVVRDALARFFERRIAELQAIAPRLAAERG